MTEQATGDCFVVAFRLVVDSDEYRLCHGTVLRQEDGLRHWHAWVEQEMEATFLLPDGGTIEAPLHVAIDKANGNDVMLPVAVYYKFGRVDDLTTYSRVEAMRLAVSHGHYGPWQDTQTDPRPEAEATEETDNG